MLNELKERLAAELDLLADELLADRMTSGSKHPTSTNGTAPDVQTRIQFLGQIVAGLATADEDTIWYDRAGFGSVVSLEDLDTGARLSYTLMGGDVIDVDAGQVSLASPIGQGLLSRRAGDEITVQVPQGRKRFRVLAVHTLPQALEVGTSNGRTAPHGVTV